MKIDQDRLVQEEQRVWYQAIGVSRWAAERSEEGNPELEDSTCEQAQSEISKKN